MPDISAEQFKNHKQFVKSMEDERSQWLRLWQDLSDYYLPQRYRWLMTDKQYQSTRARRQSIINNTGTNAARTLAAGMMNGITSPSRPWYKLRIPGIEASQIRPLAIWLEEVEHTMLQVMAESNFYNSMAVMYLDMAVFGTASNLIYEDYENVIHCYNPPLGEYCLATDERGLVNIFSRSFKRKIYQVVSRWPDRRYWSDRIKNAVEKGGSALAGDVDLCHFIAPNKLGLVPKRFKYYEMYFEKRRSQNDTGQLLHLSGFNELPGIFARWEVSGTDPYGVSPGMDALGDNIELQHLHRNKAELLEKSHKPPMMLDVALQNNPVALMPNGMTFVSNLANNPGAKPILSVNPNFAELNVDRQGIEERIRNAFYNFLFSGITDLSTVRSATEIDARESEKLILLGGVLERFESEALDPSIKRIFSICERAGLLPPRPEGFEDAPLEIQYVSILSIAQKAVGTAPAERWLGVLGNTAAVRPDVLDLTDFDKLFTNYARDIGLRESELNDPAAIEAIRQQRAEAESEAQAQASAPGLAQSAKTLSETDVGGGGNALETLLGGGGV